MLPTACIMTPIKAINNHNGHPDIYVTVTGMRNEAFKSEGNLCTHWFKKKLLLVFVILLSNTKDNDNALLQITAILWKWHLMSTFREKFLTGRHVMWLATAAPLISNLLTRGSPARITWLERFQSFLFFNHAIILNLNSKTATVWLF